MTICSVMSNNKARLFACQNAFWREKTYRASKALLINPPTFHPPHTAARNGARALPPVKQAV